MPQPRSLPSVMREVMSAAPEEIRRAVFDVMTAMLTVYTTRVRVRYPTENEEGVLVLQVYIEGPQSSGKGFVRFVRAIVLQPIASHDAEERGKEHEYMELKRCRRSQKDLPPQPQTVILLLQPNTSISMLVKRASVPMQKYGSPVTLLLVTEEISTIQEAAKRQFSNYKIAMRSGYDLGDLFGQDYLSETTCSDEVDILFSFVGCGTPKAMDQFFDEKTREGGNASRSVFNFMPDRMGEGPLCFKPFTDEQRQRIDEGLQRLMSGLFNPDGSLHDEIHLDTKWLNPTIHKWLEERRQDVVKNMSVAMDTCYKRSALSAFRMAALVQYMYELDGDKSTPEIHRYVKQVFLSSADHIYINMMTKFGQSFDESNDAESAQAYRAPRTFDLLPDEFSRDFLKRYFAENKLKTDPKVMLSKWRKKGLVENVGIDRNLFRKTKKGLM